MSNKGLGRGLSSLIPQKETVATDASQKKPLNAAASATEEKKETVSKKQQVPVRIEKKATPAVANRRKEETSTAVAEAPSTNVKEENIIHDLPVAQITPNPMQPRQHFDKRALDELAESILQYGLLEPIVVTVVEDGWQIVAGERRFRAHQLLGKDTIRATIRTASELERLELALIENIQRQDLHPIEKAQSYAHLIDDFGLTQSEAAKKLGIARSSLANTIRLLDLPLPIQDALAGGVITEGHAKVLLGLESEEDQLALFEQMTLAGKMSIKELTDEANMRSGKKSKRVSIIDHELQQVAEELQLLMGTKVGIKRKGKAGYTIGIDVFSSEELQSVLRYLRGR